MSLQIDGDAKTAVTGLRLDSTDVAAGTAPSATGVTVPAQGLIRHCVQRVNLTFKALTAAATTQDITLWTVPARSRIVRVICRVKTAFTGGSISAMALTCGSSAGGNQYLLSGSVFSGTPVLGDVVAEMGAGVVSATLADYSDSAVTVQTRFTATSDNVSSATAGECDFFIEYISYAGM